MNDENINQSTNQERVAKKQRLKTNEANVFAGRTGTVQAVPTTRCFVVHSLSLLSPWYLRHADCKIKRQTKINYNSSDTTRWQKSKNIDAATVNSKQYGGRDDDMFQQNSRQEYGITLELFRQFIGATSSSTPTCKVFSKSVTSYAKLSHRNNVYNLHASPVVVLLCTISCHVLHNLWNTN